MTVMSRLPALSVILMLALPAYAQGEDLRPSIPAQPGKLKRVGLVAKGVVVKAWDKTAPVRQMTWKYTKKAGWVVHDVCEWGEPIAGFAAQVSATGFFVVKQ